MTRVGGATALCALTFVAACAAYLGLGLPAQRAGETYPGERRDLRGVLRLGPRSCLELEVAGVRHFVIWPPGSQDADRVRLPNGEVVREGQEIVGRGALTRTAPLSGPEGSYWNTAFDICAPNADEVLVLDNAQLAT